MPVYITFDTAGWAEQAGDESKRVWHSEAGDGLGLFYFDSLPDVPAALDDLEGLRAGYRAPLAQSGGGLVALDVIDAGGVPAVRSMFKLQQMRAGLAYIGSYTLPRKVCSVVVKIQCMEHDTAGLRETVVMDEEIARGEEVALDNNGIPKDWAADPYDPGFKGGLLRTLSDDERYDGRFPDHPLSRLRRYMRAIESTIAISPEFSAMEPFAGPADGG